MFELPNRIGSAPYADPKRIGSALNADPNRIGSAVSEPTRNTVLGNSTARVAAVVHPPEHVGDLDVRIETDTEVPGSSGLATVEVVGVEVDARDLAQLVEHTLRRRLVAAESHDVDDRLPGAVLRRSVRRERDAAGAADPSRPGMVASDGQPSSS